MNSPLRTIEEMAEDAGIGAALARFADVVRADERERMAGEEIMEMNLCEATKVVLHIGQLYRFTPYPDCEACQKLKAEHDASYGPANYTPKDHP